MSIIVIRTHVSSTAPLAAWHGRTAGTGGWIPLPTRDGLPPTLPAHSKIIVLCAFTVKAESPFPTSTQTSWTVHYITTPFHYTHQKRWMVYMVMKSKITIYVVRFSAVCKCWSYVKFSSNVNTFFTKPVQKVTWPLDMEMQIWLKFWGQEHVFCWY